MLSGTTIVSVSLLNVFSHTHLQLHFPETPSKCRDTQHFINIILVIVSHHLAFAVGNATHFSQINRYKLINNSVSPFRLLTFRPISDNNVSDATLSAVARKCALLCEINFCGCDRITDEGLRLIANRCRLLIEICLDCCEEITYSGVSLLLENCGNLELLSVSDCSNISLDHISELRIAYPRLRLLSDHSELMTSIFL